MKVDEELTLKDNVVWLDKKEVIHAVFHGEQSREKLSELVSETEQICNKLIEQDLPILMLADIRDIGDHPTDARLVGMRARALLPFWRMAIVVSKTAGKTEAVSRKLTAMSSRKNEMAYFTSLPDAYHWLIELAWKYRESAH